VVASNVNGRFEFGAVHDNATEAFPSTPTTLVTTSAALTELDEIPKASIDDNNANEVRRASWRAQKSHEMYFRIGFGTPYKIGK
jgi:hypothetical protein